MLFTNISQYPLPEANPREDNAETLAAPEEPVAVRLLLDKFTLTLVAFGSNDNGVNPENRVSYK
jgi:hypothetical protein